MSRLRGMNTQERLEDISKRSGLSIDICRRVINAETASVVQSLKNGERAALIGRVILRPELKQKVGLNCKVENIIKIKADVSQTLESTLNSEIEKENKKSDIASEDSVELSNIDSLDDLPKLKNARDKGVRINQISALL